MAVAYLAGGGCLGRLPSVGCRTREKECAVNALFWLLAVAINACLLLIVTRKIEAGRVVKWGIIGFVAAPVAAVLIILVLHAVGASPSAQFRAYFFATFFTVAIILLINVMNAVCRGAVDGLASFHQTNNAANLHRFPIVILIDHREQLKLLLSTVWCLGSAIMLYGAWFDMAVVK